MNFVPSDLPRIAGATSLSKPGFDILLAVSSARQAALPTVRMLRAQAGTESRAVQFGAVRELLGGNGGHDHCTIRRPACFFDLSDTLNALPETVNSLFTRGFQPMLNPCEIERNSSATPPTDVETME